MGYNYTIIDVPDLHDSISRVVIEKEIYYLRFTYNDTGDYWTIGVYDSKKNPIAIGIKIVPNVQLNMFLPYDNLPKAAFIAMGNGSRVGLEGFKNDEFKMVIIPYSELGT